MTAIIIAILQVTCQFTEIIVQAVSPIQDIKNLYLLSMAESVPVDYIVSGDKDLTDLKQNNGIPIIKYAELLELLKMNINPSLPSMPEKSFFAISKKVCTFAN